MGNKMVAPSLIGIKSAKEKSVIDRSNREEKTMKMTTMGMDLAPSIFAIHGVNAHGKVALKRQLKSGFVEFPVG